MKFYKILRAGDVYGLEEVVIEFGKLGYKPAGGISFDTQLKLYMQAVYK